MKVRQPCHMRTVAFDTETRPIGPGAVAPEIILGTFAHRVGDDVATDLYTHADGLRAHVEHALRQAVAGAWTVVTHNGGFDYACVCVTWPDLIPLVFDALESGNLRDTLWDEKLLNLSTTGRLDAVPLPDGSSMQLEYSLSTFERKYLGRDRSAEKDENQSDEHWRVHYEALEGWTGAEIQEHAPDAYRYACEDAEGTLLVHEAQLRRLEEFRYASTATGPFQLHKSFCLYLETAWGMAVDRERVAAVRRAVEAELRGNCDLLRAAGVLSPAIGPRPFVKQLDRAAGLLTELGYPCTAMRDEELEQFDWAPHVDRLRELGIKFREPIEEKVCTAELQRVAGEAYRRIGAIPTMTAGRTDKQGVAHPQIKLGDEETEFLAAHCPIMRQYHVRKSLGKLVSNQLPILESAPVIHFKYNALVETTRTSSSGNPRGKPALFPAANGQQIPKAIEGGNVKVDPRRCYRPRDGTVFFDVDLHCLELACVGQVTHDLFGESIHLERYNAGYDLHAYLASQILVRASLAEGPERDVYDVLASLTSPEEQYDAFLAFKRCGDAALEKVYKDYRNLAKPIGLGFPGGIGPAKMVTLARTVYGVELTEEKAHELREMWRDVYPEMPRYFDWVAQQRDHYNDGPPDEEGRPTQLYWYATPMGAIRRGCTFCSEANGAAMQSPGAEAATAGNNAVVRACYDPTRGSILYGARPIAFVHDQIIGETTRDAATWHEQCMEVSRLMIEAARIALPKVRMRTEPLLTTVWTKSAEPTFDGSGRLIPWTDPKENKR